MQAVSSTTTAQGRQSGDRKMTAHQPPGAIFTPQIQSRGATPDSLFDPLRGACSTLAQAIASGNADQLRRLLREQADPAASAGYSAAHFAAAAGHAAALPLLQAAGENMHGETAAGDTPLLLAARHGHADVVRFLAKSADLYHANKDGDSALTLAAAAGHSAIVQRLLVKGAGVNHVTSALESALMRASRAGHIDVVMSLLASGACVRQMNLRRETALSLAQSNGHATVVKLLRAKGAGDPPGAASVALRRTLDKLEQDNARLPEACQDYILRFVVGDELVQATDGGVTMLMLHTRLDNIGKLDLLLGLGAALDRADNDGRTALMHAAMFGAAQSIRYLLNAGANAQHRGRHGINALHWAAWGGNRTVVAQLLEHGLDIDSRLTCGPTALDVAAICGKLAVVNLLLSRRASLAADQYGNTALLHAAQHGHTDIVQRLLGAGADPARVNAAGDNALDCALREKRKGVIALLRRHGVKPAGQ